MSVYNYYIIYGYTNWKFGNLYDRMVPFSKPSNRMQRREPQIIGRVSRITCHICQVGSVMWVSSTVSLKTGCKVIYMFVFFGIYCFLFYLVQHQPSINAPSSTRPNEVDPDPTSPIGLEQSPVEDAGAADDHYESAHNSEDINEPEVTFVVQNIYNARIPNSGILSLLSYFVITGKD